MKQEDVSTPAVLIDDEIAKANIAAFQAYCDANSLNLRPHIKTHKLPRYALAQLEAGAVGITCQKISEAEVMADHGVRDIFLTYNILGSSKLDRLIRLAGRLESLRVVSDNEQVVRGLGAAAVAANLELDVLVECDTGAKRCGVQTPEAAAELAGLIAATDGLRFVGLMTYPPVGGAEHVQEFMTEAVERLSKLGMSCPVISSGGSPDMWTASQAPIVTEYRIGTYIYNDRSLVDRGVCSWDDCALTILATIVSTPTPSRAIIDAGSKILTSDLLGLEGHGHVLRRPDLIISALSEEHGTLIAVDNQRTGLQVGDRIQIVPNHCCVVSNMVDEIYLHTKGTDLTALDVAARGCLT